MITMTITPTNTPMHAHILSPTIAPLMAPTDPSFMTFNPYQLLSIYDAIPLAISPNIHSNLNRSFGRPKLIHCLNASIANSFSMQCNNMLSPSDRNINNININNCNYKKRMFLFNNKLFTLLFGCVIILNKAIHININANRINCISSSHNNTRISISQSTNEPTHAPISTESTQSKSIFTSCNIFGGINNNLFNNNCHVISN